MGVCDAVSPDEDKTLVGLKWDDDEPKTYANLGEIKFGLVHLPPVAGPPVHPEDDPTLCLTINVTLQRHPDGSVVAIFDWVSRNLGSYCSPVFNSPYDCKLVVNFHMPDGSIMPVDGGHFSVDCKRDTKVTTAPIAVKPSILNAVQASFPKQYVRAAGCK